MCSSLHRECSRRYIGRAGSGRSGRGFQSITQPGSLHAAFQAPEFVVHPILDLAHVDAKFLPRGMAMGVHRLSALGPLPWCPREESNLRLAV
jgi:hypothetical protein